MLEKIAGIEQHYEQLGRDLEEVGNDYKRAAEINKERLSLIEDYKKCIKKAGEDETKAAACERYREAADSLSK